MWSFGVLLLVLVAYMWIRMQMTGGSRTSDFSWPTAVDVAIVLAAIAVFIR